MPWELEQDVSFKKVIEHSSPKKVLVIIGPEGGFSYKEKENAVQSGAKTITLGPRILRTETAGMSILAMFNYIFSR